MPLRCLPALFTLILLPVVNAAAQTPATPHSSPSKTQVVMLGTGTPVADPDTSGPAVAIVVNGAA
ncbi:MAG: MBL fold metallo-hydrolase, partial [Candidatus Acidiferrum sp.]